MGKWIDRLQAKTEHPFPGGADETDETRPDGVLSVMSVGAERGPANLGPAEPGPDVAAVTWTDADIARFLHRRARLLRWGWGEADAERVAERLVIRDRGGDVRVNCTECMHYKPGRCGNPRRAGLEGSDVGRDLATRLQHCAGFEFQQGVPRALLLPPRP